MSDNDDLFGSEPDSPPASPSRSHRSHRSSHSPRSPAASPKPADSTDPLFAEESSLEPMNSNLQLETDLAFWDYPDKNPDNLYLSKLPIFLNVEPTVYNPKTYVHITNDSPENIRLSVENTIRWRNITKDNQTIKDSNARLIRWSNGSYSLLLGDEIFPIQTIQHKHDPHQYLMTPHKHLEGGEHEMVLQTQVKVEQEMKVLKNEASHRKLASALAGKHSRVSRTVLRSLPDEPSLSHTKDDIALSRITLNARRRKAVEKHGLSINSLEADDIEDESERRNAERLRVAKQPPLRSQSMYANLENSKAYFGSDSSNESEIEEAEAVSEEEDAVLTASEDEDNTANERKRNIDKTDITDIFSDSENDAEVAKESFSQARKLAKKKVIDSDDDE
ncbi:Paf1 complex component [Nowakowskiella sp. JEL0078]|nr:Paf1 complex component [Nowakowskiella sp. JEL0078]